MVYLVAVTFASVGEKNAKTFASVTIQMQAIEQFFPVVLFIMLYKVVLTFESWMKS